MYVPHPFAGYEAGTDGPFNGSPPWLSFSVASRGNGRSARLGIATASCGNLRTRLLLALASGPGLPDRGSAEI